MQRCLQQSIPGGGHEVGVYEVIGGAIKEAASGGRPYWIKYIKLKYRTSLSFLITYVFKQSTDIDSGDTPNSATRVSWSFYIL